MTASRSPVRLLRGGTAATLATAVALGGHLAGGGAMPGWLGLLLPWWLAVAASTLLAGTRFSLPRMGAAVLVSQALFHGLFVAGTPGDPTRTLVAPPGSHLGHDADHPTTAHLVTSQVTTSQVAPHAGHGTGATRGGADGVVALADHALHGSHADLRMLLLHVLAAVVTTLALQHGESVLMRCFGLALAALELLARPLLLLVLRLIVSELPSRPCPEAPHLLHAQRAVLTPQRRRGPPVVLAA